MERERPITILCIASFFKGNAFFRACKAAGCHVVLLTVDRLLDADWARDAIDEVFAMPVDFSDRAMLINAVSYLARTRPIDRIVPLDDYDVEVAALLREHLRVPGMGESTARYFRDKLAMRERALERKIRVPGFVGAINHDAVRAFLRDVPGPWVLKPRTEAGGIGIKKVHNVDEVFRALDELGDRQSHHLIEKMIMGDVLHVDSVIWDSQVVFAASHRYRRPLLSVVQGGGIFGTRRLVHGSTEETALRAFHDDTIAKLGLVRGVAHTEFIHSAEDGELYFLETGARVGGAHIAELVEAEAGVNLWAEWAKLEAAHAAGRPYAPPVARTDHGGLLISLTRQEHPDVSSFDDPEVVWRLTGRSHHLGLVVCSPSADRVEELLDAYEPRIVREFQAVLPAPDKALD